MSCKLRNTAGMSRETVDPPWKSSTGSRSDASLRSLAIRNRSYPTPQAGGRRLHLVSQSPACAVLATSALTDDCQSRRNQIMRSRGRKWLKPEPSQIREKAVPLHIRIYPLATFRIHSLRRTSSAPTAGAGRRVIGGVGVGITGNHFEWVAPAVGGAVPCSASVNRELSLSCRSCFSCGVSLSATHGQDSPVLRLYIAIVACVDGSIILNPFLSLVSINWNLASSVNSMNCADLIFLPSRQSSQ